MHSVIFILKEFLGEGRIGPITFGITKDAVVAYEGDHGRQCGVGSG